MFSTSETTRVPIWAASPPRTLALAPASPDSKVVASRPMPTARIRAICLSSDHGNPARRDNGTPHTVFSAFCAAAATPRAPRKVSTIPMISAIPVPLTVCPAVALLSVPPMPGKWENAELSTLALRVGSWASTMSSTVTSTSSSGNSDANP